MLHRSGFSRRVCLFYPSEKMEEMFVRGESKNKLGWKLLGERLRISRTCGESGGVFLPCSLCVHVFGHLS